jgi:hypothetical protein
MEIAKAEKAPAVAVAETSSGNPWRYFLYSLPLVVAAVVLLAVPKKVEAVPAFEDQTGQPCQACHVGGLGPHLTPFGREFKLNGYTLHAKSFSVPLAAMGIASLTHTKADQNPAPEPPRNAGGGHARR